MTCVSHVGTVSTLQPSISGQSFCCCIRDWHWHVAFGWNFLQAPLRQPSARTTTCCTSKSTFVTAAYPAPSAHSTLSVTGSSQTLLSLSESEDDEELELELEDDLDGIFRDVCRQMSTDLSQDPKMIHFTLRKPTMLRYAMRKASAGGSDMLYRWQQAILQQFLPACVWDLTTDLRCRPEVPTRPISATLASQKTNLLT